MVLHPRIQVGDPIQALRLDPAFVVIEEDERREDGVRALAGAELAGLHSVGDFGTCGIEPVGGDVIPHENGGDQVADGRAEGVRPADAIVEFLRPIEEAFGDHFGGARGRNQ